MRPLTIVGPRGFSHVVPDARNITSVAALNVAMQANGCGAYREISGRGPVKTVECDPDNCVCKVPASVQ
jgi:hypothetical protein